MDSHRFGTGQQPRRESGLHEDLATGQRDTALGGSEHAPVAPYATQKLVGLDRFPVPHEEGVGIVAVEAAQRAAVEENSHPRARPVHRGHELPGVDGSERPVAHPG